MPFGIGEFIGLASVAVSAYGAVQGGRARSEAEGYNAEAYALEAEARKENAKLLQEQTLQQQQQRRRDLARTVASNRATAAALGYDVSGGGSFEAVQNDTISQAMLDISNIGITGELAYKRELLGIQQAQTASRAASSAADSASTTGWLTAGATAGAGIWDAYRAGAFSGKAAA